LTYYVVAQMGQNNLSSFNYFASDYMLETIVFQYYLLFINTSYLYKEGYNYPESTLLNSSAISFLQLDVSRKNILLKSQNNNIKDSLGSTI